MEPGAAADLQFFGQIRVVVPVEVADVDAGGPGNEVFEDRTLIDAVAAPRPGQHENLHVADEGLQQRLLIVGQTDAGMELVPTLPLVVGGVLLQKLAVRQSGLKLCRKVHHVSQSLILGGRHFAHRVTADSDGRN